MATSPLIVILGSGPIDATVSVASADWDLLSLAVKGAQGLKVHYPKIIASEEVIRHPGGALQKFWRSVYNSFDG